MNGVQVYQSSPLPTREYVKYKENETCLLYVHTGGARSDRRGQMKSYEAGSNADFRPTAPYTRNTTCTSRTPSIPQPTTHHLHLLKKKPTPTLLLSLWTNTTSSWLRDTPSHHPDESPCMWNLLSVCYNFNKCILSVLNILWFQSVVNKWKFYFTSTKITATN